MHVEFENLINFCSSFQLRIVNIAFSYEFSSVSSWMEKLSSDDYNYLLPVVNFINVKHANFSYKRHFSSFFSSYMYVVKAVWKIHMFNIDEIDTRKSTLRFFALRSLQFWEMALVFNHRLGNFAWIFSLIWKENKLIIKILNLAT